MKKILPMTFPPITTFQGYANQLAILYSYPEAYDWIYEHYIQTHIFKMKYGKSGEIKYSDGFFSDVNDESVTPSGHYSAFEKNKAETILRCDYIPISLIKNKNNSFVFILKQLIDASGYLSFGTVVSCISSYNISKDKYREHSPFVYGYDDNKKIFHFADFIEGHYKFSTCSYTEMENSIIKYQEKHNIEIRFIRMFHDIFSYELDFELIKMKIKRYIEPEINKQKLKKYRQANNYIEQIHMEIIQGIEVYKYFGECLVNSDGNTYIDYRLWHAQYDHKEMMLKRFDYLNEKGYLDDNKIKYFDQYKAVRNNSLIMRNKILKYNIEHNKKNLLKIPTILEETKQLEIELLTKIFLE